MKKSEHDVQNELEALLTSEEADDLYDAVPGARTKVEGRLILNTDLAREVSPDYQSFADRIAFTRATYAPARDYVMRRFIETVEENRGPNRRAFILAGGPASGKTYTVNNVNLEDFDIIFDTTFADFHRADQIITKLLQFNWSIQIRYVYRPYVLAVESMLERARCCGRYVPLGHPSRLAEMHVKAQRTFLQILAKYPDVPCGVVGNFWTPANSEKCRVLRVADVDRGGPLHYDEMDGLHAEQKDVLDRFKKAQESLTAAIEAVH